MKIIKMKNTKNLILFLITINCCWSSLMVAQPVREEVVYYSDYVSSVDWSYLHGVATSDNGLLLAETAEYYNPGGLLYSKMNLTKRWGSFQTNFDFSNPIAVPDYTQSDKTTCLEADGSGNYYAGGKYYYDNVYKHDAVLIKYNSSLVEVWRQYLYSGPSGGGTGPDDYTISVYAKGNKLYWLGYLGQTGYFLACYSDIGAQLFFTNVSTFTPQMVRVNASGDVYVLGSSTSGTNGSQVVLQKLNSSGVQVWKKTYNALAGLNADLPAHMEIDASGDIYFTAACERTVGNSDAMLVKYNSSGTRVWSKYINGSANSNDGAGKLCFDGSGNIVVAYTVLNSNLGVYNYDVCMRKYSPTGSTLATRYYKGSGNKHDNPENIYFAPNGRFYLIAQTSVDNVTVKSVVAQYDPSLNLEYTDVMTHSFNPYGFPDNVYIGVTTSVLDRSGMFLYWIGTKSSVTYAMGLDNIIAPFIIKYSLPVVPRMSESESTMEDSKLSLFPNPASDQVFINSKNEIRQLEVYDESGRLIWQEEDLGQNTQRLDIQLWRNGVYVVRVTDQENQVETSRLVKQ